MSKQLTTNEWMDAWSADQPPLITYSFVPRSSDVWKPGLTRYFEYRDLGVKAATGGLISAQHVRAARQPKDSSGWHCHNLDFQCFYVLNGSIRIENEAGDDVVLRRGSTGYHPPLLRHSESEISADYEFIEITAPATSETIVGRETSLPEKRGRAGTVAAHYTHDEPGSWELGAGPRSWFEYRDLHVDGPTDGRIHLHVLRAPKPQEAGTGWHYHSMGQLFMVLEGEADAEFESEPKRRIRQGDAMCIGAGIDNRHNISRVTAGYSVIELCVPARYDTIPVDAPGQV